MKHFLPVAWWLAATVVIALVLVSLGYPFTDALLLGARFLPGMLAARYFVPQLSFRNPRQGIFDAVYLALGILCIEYLALMLAGRYILGAGVGQMPGLLLNPVFLLLIPALSSPPRSCSKTTSRPAAPTTKRSVSYPSGGKSRSTCGDTLRRIERQRSLAAHRIGEAYRTKTRISQWESQLDRRFLRIHRSYIVNTAHVDEYHPLAGQRRRTKSKFPANTRTPHGCGSSPLRANNAPQPANGNYCQHIRQCGHFPDGIKPRYLHYGNNEPEKATCRRET